MTIRRFAYRIGKLNSLYRRIFYYLFKKNAPYYKVNGQKVIKDYKEANAYISRRIAEGEPFMVGRFGSVELSAITEFYKNAVTGGRNYLPIVRHNMCNNAGFFPKDDEMLDAFVELMLDSCSHLDLIGLWNNNLELFTVKEYAKNARGMLLACMEPYYDIDSAWTKALKGKRVLVIHPFAQTIQRQFLVKDKIFPEGFWPDCELITIQAVQTIAGEKDDRFETWFDALHHMERQIDETEFDIAIIGCGAYGFPLAAYVKSKGKQAIHLGGATQLLFGIKGKRWEGSEIEGLFNEYWTRPVESERPKNLKKVEEGCYW